MAQPRASKARDPSLALPGLPADTLALLDALPQPVPEPVRSELFGAERFRQHGISLARAQPVERRRRWRRRIRTPHFFPRIAANLRSVERARAYLEVSDRGSEVLRPAAEWLLDNFHLIEAQVPEIRNGLPASYYATLPKLREQPLIGLPRVYGIAWAFVAHTDSGFDAALLTQLLEAYQEVDQLTLGELWAVPSTLRVVLLENLARLAELAACHQAAQEAADLCFDQQDSVDLAAIDALHLALTRRGLAPVFLAQMIVRLRSHMGGDAPPWAAWLAAKAPDPGALLTQVHAMHAANNVSVSNAVSALHAINNLSWKPLIDQVSPVVQMLRRSPAFAADSELTQDQCTHAVERFARRLNCSESEVARRVIELATAAGDPVAIEGGSAHWLIGDGRTDLVRSLGGSEATVERPVPRWLNRARGALYAGALIVGTVLLLSATTGEHSWRHLTSLAALALASLAAFECAASIVNRILAELVRVHRLPRIALEAGLEAEHRTLVVVPCLLSSPADAGTLAHRLEQHYLANPEAHTRYALLSDWPDAPEQTMPSDDSLLAAARAAVEALNQRHPATPGDDPRFALLHRARTWSEGENVWMGWERKRGKLEQLVAALADPAARAASPFFDLGELSRLREGVRYLVTLDSDTVMPPGVLRTMVAIAAHPLNRPRFDPKTRRVVAGYGILQPGIAAPLPCDDEVTAFGWLFSGPWGFDVYNAGSSEIFQDVFGQGRFSGKGLLDVHAIHESLCGRVPENSLLSHDLYEGVWARTAHLSDVQLVESAPMHPDVAGSRLHRWTRGDWQLLPLVGSSLRGRVGALNLWKIFDNLRRSLLAPASLLLLWLCMATDALDPWTGLGLTAAAFGLGPVVGALAALLPARRDLALRHFAREGLRDLGRALGGTLWQLLTLPQAAARETDAIVRALWRMLISRRRLLEWTTAAQAQAASRLDLGGFWRRHFGVTLLSIAWVATGAWLPDAQWPWLVGIGSLWALTPLWFWGGSQPMRPRDPHHGLNAAERHELRQLAQDTWRLFETIVTPAEHHLPPDNLQLDPEPIVAHRTSPTNVGLYLCSCVCAHRFGFIDTAQLADRLEATLATLTTLPRWHGHFDNWIDTTNLRPLTPRYISTVDSGNLVACLWTVAQACRETAALPPRSEDEAAPHHDLSERLSTLAERLVAIADQTDFSVLYDRRRRLFHIGYRQDDARMDPAHYDLLASESRLASYVSIAKGDVPLEHWSALGRPFLGIDGEPALRSWSGSMFEYLMPSLLMREPRRSLLQRVSVAAVRAQRSFGERQGVPWGVSESAYFEQDPSLAFQYGPFGVPQLALRRTPLDDLVIAPYASVLALLVDPVAALANLRELEALGARDRYGFIDALDFSPARRGDARRLQRVATVMAHHQGMSLLSLCNVLCDDDPRGWFERAPRSQAFDTLLHERLPRAIVFQSRAIPRRAHDDDTRAATLGARVLDPATAPATELPTALIGNGRYSVCLRPNGAGHSRWRGRAITRTREDRLRDAQGHWMLLRTDRDAAFHSLTLAPCPAPDARYQTRILGNQVDFETTHPAWDSTLSVWVSPDDDVELRRVVLHNLSDQAAEFELMSLFEPVLAPQEADESHPAFSNLFVSASAVDASCMLFERRPRRQSEQGLRVVHFLAASDAEVADVRMHCDRAQVLPRGGDVGQARIGPGGPAKAGDTLDTGLDPVASLTVRLRIEARARVCVTLGTAAAPDFNTLMALVDQYRQELHLTRSRLMSATLARIRQRELQLTGPMIQLAQDLTTQVMMAPLQARKAPEVALDRRALWRFATSGDRPIVLVRIDNVQGLRNVRALLTVHRIWQFGDLVVDLLIVNGEPASYLMPLQRRLIEAFGLVGADPDQDTERGLARVLRASDLSPREWAALRACARIELVADGRPLERLFQTPRAVDPAPSPTRHRPAGSDRGGSARKLAAGAGARPVRRRRRVLRPADRRASPHAKALGQCDGQSAVRLHRHRVGRWPHLGREQPAQPAHGLEQRPLARPRGRAVSGPGQRQRRDLWPAAHARPQRHARLPGLAPRGHVHVHPGARRPGGRDLRHGASARGHEMPSGAPAQPGRRGTPAATARPGRVGARRPAARSFDPGHRIRRRHPGGAGAPARAQRRLRRRHGLPDAGRAVGRRMDLRPSAVLRPRGSAVLAGRVVTRAWLRPRSLRGNHVQHHARARCQAGVLLGRRLWPGAGGEPGAGASNGRARRARCARRAGGVALERAPVGSPGRDARPALRCPGQPMAALPDPVLPAVGQGRLLPGRWRDRISRPAPGRDGIGDDKAGAAARPAAAARVAPVRRGRRAALVARTDRGRRSHPFERRPAVVALRSRALRRDEQRPGGAGRTGDLPEGLGPVRAGRGCLRGPDRKRRLRTPL